MGLFDVFKKKGNVQTSPALAPKSVPVPKQEEPKPTYKTINFDVAGISFYENDILDNLMFENDDYNLKKKELIEDGMTNERIYQFEPDFIKAELVPDPENEHDPNAVKVVVDGVLIGFVPAKKAKKVKKIIEDMNILSLACAIGGGPYRIIIEEYDEDKDKDIYTEEKDIIPIWSKISINYE